MREFGTFDANGRYSDETVHDKTLEMRENAKEDKLNDLICGEYNDEQKADGEKCRLSGKSDTPIENENYISEVINKAYMLFCKYNRNH